MPLCRLCLRTQPTAEVRRTQLGFICKDKIACSGRVSHVQELAKKPVMSVTAALPYDPDMAALKEKGEG